MTLRKWLFLLLLPLFCAACGKSGLTGPRYGLQDLALSPDGHLLAVRFFDHELKKPGFGLYDWQRGKFTAIRSPAPDRGFTDPSFSPDGKSLVAVSGNQIVRIALDSLAVTALTEGGEGFKESPVFLPDDSGILYVTGSPAHYMLIDLADRREKEMLDPALGFGRLSRAFFGGPDRIIFTAANPADFTLREQLEQFPDSRPATDLHVYGMKFGAMPELILKNLWIEGKKKSPWFSGQQTLQASKDAKRIIFIDQELFLIEGSELKQMTHLDSALIAASISYDGSTAAFGCDSSHSGDYRLCVLDLNSGKVTKIGLQSDLRVAD